MFIAQTTCIQCIENGKYNDDAYADQLTILTRLPGSSDVHWSHFSWNKHVVGEDTCTIPNIFLHNKYADQLITPKLDLL